MLSFTIPSTVRGKTIKKGRYTKLRTLIDIRAYIAKLLNNSNNVKYFMNIELGKAYSNPHIHVQLWIKKNSTSSTIPDSIRNKTIKKFNLNSNRCDLTIPEKNLDVYHYVVKDYAKDLTDKQIWDLEIQKKRMRSQLGKNVRFYSKSTDLFTKKVYKILFKWGILRNIANEYLVSFLDKFFYFNKKRLPKVIVFCSCFSNLIIYRTRGMFFDSFIFIIEVFSFAPCRDPPFLYRFPDVGKMVLYLQVKNLILKEFDMYMFCFTRVFLFRSFLFRYGLRCRSPCLFMGFFVFKSGFLLYFTKILTLFKLYFIYYDIYFLYQITKE